MELTCPRCRTASRPAARYCAKCGIALGPALEGGRAGRIADPHALPAPAGFEPLANATDLYYRMESSFGGGPPLATESVRVVLFNAGYGLADVVLKVSGSNADGRELALEQTLKELPQGKQTDFEVQSYDLPDPPVTLRIELGSAEFAPPE